MKRCPSCKRTYTDTSLNFCLEDGSPLVSEFSVPFDPHATVRDSPHPTGEPPVTEIYRQQPMLNRVPEISQPTVEPTPQWAPTPQPQKKSSAIWWLVGGVAVVGILGVGMILMILAVSKYSADLNNENVNATVANNNRTVTTNRNANVSSNTNTNTNTKSEPISITDDFSDEKWRTGSFQFGDIWYKDGEYHMRSKEKTYLVMYAPSSDYSTENATVQLTTRNVDGIGPTSGYGLIVHGHTSSSNQLQDYALLIYTGDQPQYQVVMHKGGQQSTLLPWTKSTVIRSGTSPNQLEVRIQGSQLMFYINGRYLNRITDTENFKSGVAGLYTSETSEVVFDDLEIKRSLNDRESPTAH